jgi:hypothetical protein
VAAEGSGCLVQGLAELFAGAAVDVVAAGAAWRSGLLPNRPAVLFAAAGGGGAAGRLCAHAHAAAEAAGAWPAAAAAAAAATTTTEEEAFFAQWVAGDMAAAPLELPPAAALSVDAPADGEAEAAPAASAEADDAAGPARGGEDKDARPPAPADATTSGGARAPPNPPATAAASADGVLAALAERAAGHRRFLLAHVMPTLTRGMLRVVREAPEDPIEFLADFLCFQGNLAEARATAQAKLQFTGLVAKARWIEMMEKAEEEEAARQAASNEGDDD